MKKIALLAFVCATLGACSAPILAPVQREVAAADAAAKPLLQQARQGSGAIAEEHRPDVRYVDELFLPTKRETVLDADARSRKMLERSFRFDREVRNIQDVAARITFLTKIPVTVSPDVLQFTQAAAAAAKTSASSSATPAAVQPPGQFPSFPNSPGAYQAAVTPLDYKGDIKTFLDLVSAQFGISWTWSNNTISFYRYTTRTFKIYALPQTTTMDGTVSNQSGSVGGAGGSSTGGATGGSSTSGPQGGSSTTTDVAVKDLDIWASVRETLLSMVTNKTGVVVSAAGSSVTVTDTPDTLNRVADYIASVNESLHLQVVVNVKIYSVNLNKSHEYGINMGALYNSLSGNYGIGLANSFATSTGDSSLSLHISGIPGSGVPGNPGVKAWQGSTAMISALSEQGDVSEVTSASPWTLNNQATHVLVGGLFPYLASSSSTLAANVGQTVTLTPGIYTTGLSMSMIPNIVNKSELLLHYNLNLSSLIKLDQITSGGSVIQLPSRNERNFIQSVGLRSGDTLVLSGFEQEIRNATGQGVGAPTNLLLGGGATTQSQHVVLVILIQPIIEHTGATRGGEGV